LQDGPYLDDADQAVRQGLVAVLADSYGPEPALHVVRATRTILLRAVRTRGAGPLAPWAPHYTVRTPYAYQPRACRTCRVLWHHRWRYSRNAWPECSMRFMGRVECEHLLCDWCGRGCSCYSANCSVSRLGGANVCHNSTGRTWAKGAAQHVVGKQLFADSDVATFR
jgi:hypothetical protein